MLDHLPTTGIFVFYAVAEDACYYDFSNAIYERIMDDKQSDDWIENENVNIRIPVGNKLTPEGNAGLKKEMEARFGGAAKMQAAHGHKYSLPVINLLHDTFDPHNPQHLKKLLKDYGLVFLSQYNVSIIYGALNSLGIEEVNADKDLLILSALSFCEVGKYLDSDLYVRKARYKFDLTSQEKNMLDYVDLKNRLQLGQITTSEFQQSLETLKGDNDRNNIIIDINILRYSLADDMSVSADQTYKDQLADIFDRISKSNLPDGIKQLYNLWNAMNESLLVGNAFSYAITLHRTSLAVGNELPNETKSAVHQELSY